MTHIYGMTAFNFAVGETREQVLAKLAKDCGEQLIKRQVKANGGLYAWTCEVEADIKQSYDIEDYVPKGVKWHGSQEHMLLNGKGKFETMAPRVIK